MLIHPNRVFEYRLKFGSFSETNGYLFMFLGTSICCDSLFIRYTAFSFMEDYRLLGLAYKFG